MLSTMDARLSHEYRWTYHDNPWYALNLRSSLCPSISTRASNRQHHWSFPRVSRARKETLAQRCDIFPAASITRSTLIVLPSCLPSDIVRDEIIFNLSEIFGSSLIVALSMFWDPTSNKDLIKLLYR